MLLCAAAAVCSSSCCCCLLLLLAASAELRKAFFSLNFDSLHESPASEMAPPPQIDIGIVACIFLSVLGHFLPPWADKILVVLVFLLNLSVAAKYNFTNLPNWFILLLLVQAMSIISGFNTDHDPLDGEWGGKSEPNEWF